MLYGYNCELEFWSEIQSVYKRLSNGIQAFNELIRMSLTNPSCAESLITVKAFQHIPGVWQSLWATKIKLFENTDDTMNCFIYNYIWAVSWSQIDYLADIYLKLLQFENLIFQIDTKWVRKCIALIHALCFRPNAAQILHPSSKWL